MTRTQNTQYDSTERTQRKGARGQRRKALAYTNENLRCLGILCVFAPLRLCVETLFLHQSRNTQYTLRVDRIDHAQALDPDILVVAAVVVGAGGPDHEGRDAGQQQLGVKLTSLTFNRY